MNSPIITHQPQLFTPQDEISYEAFCASTDSYPLDNTHRLALALGLSAEAGEVAGKFTKALRDGWTEDRLGRELIPELGDVLWYLTRLATLYGLSLADIATENRTKLRGRTTRGTLAGSGDVR